MSIKRSSFGFHRLSVAIVYVRAGFIHVYHGQNAASVLRFIMLFMANGFGRG